MVGCPHHTSHGCLSIQTTACALYHGLVSPPHGLVSPSFCRLLCGRKGCRGDGPVHPQVLNIAGGDSTKILQFTDNNSWGGGAIQSKELTPRAANPLFATAQDSTQAIDLQMQTNVFTKLFIGDGKTPTPTLQVKTTYFRDLSMSSNVLGKC